MVEMAMLLPVLMLIFLGAWTAANLIDDNDAAAQATRAGARLAAELGNGSSLGLTQAQVDRDIIDQVLPIVSPQLTNAQVTEIDIYQCPTDALAQRRSSAGTCPPNNGAYCSTVTTPSSSPSENIDTYTVTSGGVVSGSVYESMHVYTLANCGSQVHPRRGGARRFASSSSTHHQP